MIGPAEQWVELADGEVSNLAGINLAGELGESNEKKSIRSIDLSPAKPSTGNGLPWKA